MTENQRLGRIMRMLNLRSQKSFASKLGIQQGSLSDVLRARNGLNVSKAIKEKLVRVLNINLDWFETGEGEPFLDGFPQEETGGGVPYYNIPVEDTNNISMMEAQPEYFINYKPFNDCLAYLPVFGDSMYPRFASGEVIAIKEIKNQDIIQWGEAYVVITDEQTNSLRTIKLLHEHIDKSKIILRSSNPNFKGDTVLKRENIVTLYIVKGKITRNII